MRHPPKVQLKTDGPFSTLRWSKVPTNNIQLQVHHNISLEMLKLRGGGTRVLLAILAILAKIACGSENQLLFW